MATVTRFQFADMKTMKEASDVLTDSGQPLIAIILSAEDNAVIVHAKDKELAIILFEQAGLLPREVETRQAIGDECAIMDWVVDAPKLDEQGWTIHEEEASFHM